MRAVGTDADLERQEGLDAFLASRTPVVRDLESKPLELAREPGRERRVAALGAGRRLTGRRRLVVPDAVPEVRVLPQEDLRVATGVGPALHVRHEDRQRGLELLRRAVRAELPRVDLSLQRHLRARLERAPAEVEVGGAEITERAGRLAPPRRGDPEADGGGVAEREVLEQPREAGEALTRVFLVVRSRCGPLPRDVQLGEPRQRREPREVDPRTGEDLVREDPAARERRVDEVPDVRVLLVLAAERAEELTGAHLQPRGKVQGGQVRLLHRGPLARRERDEDVGPCVRVDHRLEPELQLLEERSRLVLRTEGTLARREALDVVAVERAGEAPDGADVGEQQEPRHRVPAAAALCRRDRAG